MQLTKIERCALSEWSAKKHQSLSQAIGPGKKNCRLPGFGRTTVSWVSFPYDPQKARSDLRFLSGYWFGKREPKPTTKPWKCRKCRVNAVGLCSVALAPYQ